MAFKFENLEIWKVSVDLTAEIYSLTKSFPRDELFSLTNQIRKASDSVALNIAEGCTGQSFIEFRRFLRYALRSCIEVVSCLFIARQKSFIKDDTFQKYYEDYERLCKRISKLIQVLDKKILAS